MAVTINDGSLQWVAGIDTSQLKRQIGEIQGLMNGVQQKAEEEARAIDNLARKAATGFAAYLSINAATGFLKQMVTVRGEFQKLEVAFQTMLGSKEKADKLLAEVTEFAATTPFGLDEVAKATKQLLAFGIGAKDIEKTLRSLGDISSGIGAPLGEIAYLYGTIKTAGVAMTQDIRQFAQRGIPIYEELAKVLGVTVDQVGELVTAGKVGFPEIQRVFENLTAAGSKFGGLMEAQSKTLAGQISNLQDAVDQMFNSLGKSSEGVVSTVLAGVTTIVENYQTVIDILKILIVTYGAYKAAVIAATVVQRVQQEIMLQQALAGRRLNSIQALSAVLTTNLQRAWKTLNLTMKANPIGLVIGAVAGLITAMAVLTDRTTAQERAQKRFNEAQEEQKQRVEEIKNRTSELTGIIRDETNTRFTQVQAFKELQRLYPDLLNKMTLATFKTMSAEEAQKGLNAEIDKTNFEELQRRYADAAAVVKKYADILDNPQNRFGAGAKESLTKKLQEAQAEADRYAQELRAVSEAAFEANTPIEQQVAHYKSIEANLIRQKRQFQDNIQQLNEMGASANFMRIMFEQTNIDGLSKQLDEVRKKLADLTGSTDVQKNKQYWEAQKKTAEDTLAAVSTTDKNFNTIKAQQVKIIREAEKELEKYNTTLKKTPSNKLENERNSLLEKRLALLQQIADLERDARNTGLTDEENLTAQINERYDRQLRAIAAINEEIKKFNKANPTKPVTFISDKEVDRVNASRAIELANVQYKKDAENYIQAIQEKEDAFRAFQEAVKSNDIATTENARKVYEKDLQGFETYLDFLQAEYDKLFRSMSFDGTDDIGTVTRFSAIQKMILEEQKRLDAEQKKNDLERFANALQELETYNRKRAAIIKKYNDLEQQLNAKRGLFSPEEYEKMKQALEKARQEELTAVDNDVVRQSDLYKRLNQDIIRFTRDRLKEEVKLLKANLKDKNLTPEMRADIEATIQRYESLLDETNKVATSYEKLSGKLNDISGAFGDLGTALQGVNENLAGTLMTLGEITSVGAKAANAISQFAQGNIVQGIVATVDTIVGIFNIGGRVREARKKAEAEMRAFQDKVMAGEIDINVLYRQRLIEQAKLNKLKIDGLKAERDQLSKNAEQNRQDYERILALIQKESYVSGQTTRNSGGVFGIGATARVVNEMSSLAGMNYDQLEKLFMEGRLNDRAKELFETLQKLKEEGVDIDKALEDSRQQLKELYTGTTADSISQAILEAFKNGERGAADLADEFESLMQQALLRSLQFRALEAPLQEFFDQFAADAESGNSLDLTEIDRLRQLYNSIIDNASQQFQQLQDIAGLNFGSMSSSGGSTVSSAIRGMTEQQAELLAGQFGGLRITASEALKVAQSQLAALANIEVNTYRLHKIADILKRLEDNGIKVI